MTDKDAIATSHADNHGALSEDRNVSVSPVLSSLHSSPFLRY